MGLARAWLALAAAVLPCHRAKVLEGHVTGNARLHSADHSLVVLGSFGYECVSGACGVRVPDASAHLYAKGMLHIEAHGDPFILGQEIAMFSSDAWINGTDEVKAPWTSVYKNTRLSCAEKRRQAIFTLPLSADERPAEGASASIADTVNFYHALRLSHRPLFVHVVALNCNPDYGGALSMYYRVTLQNPGGWWASHFSYNDQGMLQTHLFWLFALVVLATYAVRLVLDLHNARLSHPPMAVLAGALCLFALSQLLDLVFYADYASHGLGPEGALVLGEVVFMASDLSIMVLFLMIAQGWRLTEDAIPSKDQLLVGGAVLVYCGCYSIIYAVDYAMRDPASEVYVLLSTGAFFLALIRCMLFALCALFFYDTVRREPSVEKLGFFRKALVSCAVWFLQMPLVCLVAWMCDKGTRHRTATTWMALFNLGTLGFLLFAFQPSRAKSYFNITAHRSELDGLTRDVDDHDAGRAGPAANASSAERYGRLTDERSAGPGLEPRSRQTVADEGML